MSMLGWIGIYVIGLVVIAFLMGLGWFFRALAEELKRDIQDRDE